MAEPFIQTEQYIQEKMNLIDHLIPKQKKGSQTGATARCKASSLQEAKTIFDKAKNRLLAINNWYNICEHKGAEFLLTDNKGKPRIAVPQVGNLIRILLPAPRNKDGDGFDWVAIEKIEHLQEGDEEVFGFRVRPVKSPKNNIDDSAHFFTSDATSTFLVYRKGHIVYAMERGRNEVPNKTDSFITSIRNFMIGIPAMLGFSKPQWKRLVKGILECDG